MNNKVIDFGLTPDQIDLRMMVRDFAAKELTWEKMKEYDDRSEIPMEAYKKAADMGLTAITLPERFGGSGLGQVENALIAEELGYMNAGFCTTILANGLAYDPVDLFGTDEQKALFAKYIVDGGFAAFALTEANAGSDAGAIRTTAVREGDEYVINGTKSFITNGGVANVYVVFALTDPEAGARGISCFIVERERPGVSIGSHEDKLGIRISNTAEVIFDNVRIPADHLVGQEGKGFKISMTTFDITRPASVGAGCVGGARGLIDQCVEYAKVRTTFGQPILTNQAIQFKIADMEIGTQAARALVYRAAAMIDAGVIDTPIASSAKVAASDNLMKVASEAIQIFGGNGYSREYPIESVYRDAKIFQIFEGTNEIQHMVIVKQMLKDSMGF